MKKSSIVLLYSKRSSNAKTYACRNWKFSSQESCLCRIQVFIMRWSTAPNALSCPSCDSCPERNSKISSLESKCWQARNCWQTTNSFTKVRLWLGFSVVPALPSVCELICIYQRLQCHGKRWLFPFDVNGRIETITTLIESCNYRGNARFILNMLSFFRMVFDGFLENDEKRTDLGSFYPRSLRVRNFWRD